MDSEQLDRNLDRRRFNRILMTALGAFGVALGGAGTVAILWPTDRKTSGTINAGKLKDVLATIDRDSKPLYNVDGKFYLVRYDANTSLYTNARVVAGGVMAISQKCSHLGCRVPYCPSSGWFECPCHDAMFNRAGEVMSGPAPAGMWRHPIEISSEGDVIVDTSRRVAQPPKGFTSVQSSPLGAHCVGG